jgi:hypothetical protein
MWLEPAFISFYAVLFSHWQLVQSPQQNFPCRDKAGFNHYMVADYQEWEIKFK